MKNLQETIKNFNASNFLSSLVHHPRQNVIPNPWKWENTFTIQRVKIFMLFSGTRISKKSFSHTIFHIEKTFPVNWQQNWCKRKNSWLLCLCGRKQKIWKYNIRTENEKNFSFHIFPILIFLYFLWTRKKNFQSVFQKPCIEIFGVEEEKNILKKEFF